jgi:shikimate kinase
MSEREQTKIGDGREAPPRVVITGFMAAGKTTVARALARLLGCALADMDELVRERERRAPAEIIAAEGEARFREIESRVLGDALAPGGPLVVALGGGAWAVPANRELIAERGCLAVWLDAPFELCWQRIEAESMRIGRPLARDIETARMLYHTRRETYALAAHRVEVTAEKSADALAAEIANRLARLQHEKQRENESRGRES